ncbi:MAG: hypothetical protein U9N59_16850 [Campylobacterota bacterium]|nr:hypothetical protein [Campylobacterota bacterium]
MIQINTKLLNKYFLLNEGHNVLYNISDDENFILDSANIYKVLLYLKEIIKQNKSDQGLYSIDDKEHLLLYLIEHIYHTFKVYNNKFESNDDFILFLLVCLSLQLTLFSQNGLQIIKLLEDNFRLDDKLKKKIYSYVDSNDPRGLFYYLCQINSLPYDRVIGKKLIQYEYSEPSINKKWQDKYKEDGESIVFWFYESLLGKALFLVLYSPKCRYKMEKGGCAGCNLPTVSSSSKILNDEDIKKQIENTYEHNLSKEEKLSIKEIVLSNNGSILDPKTMSKEALLYAVQSTVSSLQNLKKIIFETRIDDYTDFKQLETVSQKINKLNQNITLELAIGFEIFDDELRNGYYKKGLEKIILENKIKDLVKIDVSLKVYMMYKAVPDKDMSVDEAINDINQASKYFGELSKKYNSKINLHISPTYLATGTQLYKDYKNGLYSPLETKDIRKLYDNLDISENLSYYISMNDEGLTDDRLLNKNDYEEYIEFKKTIHKFNIENI